MMLKPGRMMPLTVALAMIPVLAASGQGMRIGTTWAIPEDPVLIEQDLRDMRTAGFVAVRIGEIAPEELLVAADSLGMLVFQDLPIRALPSDLLADTLAAARAILGGLVLATHRHPSLRAIGLADLPDTSDPRSCEYIAELSDIVRASAAPNTVSYFTTKFVDSDQCSPTTDMVMVDLLDVDTTTVRVQVAALTSLGERVGAGAIGTWTDLAIEKRGLLHERSPESQARYLERVLSSIRRVSKGGSFPIVFVHRWRDPLGTDEVFSDMVQRRYGLLNSADGRRPAFEVASGFATGRQQVFAFRSGRKASRGWTWMTLLGWGVLTALGIAWATSPRMRHMLPRYFLAHAFYREAVISGRESLVSETLALLAAVSGGVGMLLAILAKEVSFLSAFSVGRTWLPPDVLNFAGALLDQPWTLTVILASAYALLYVVWTSVLSLMTHSRQTLLPAQAMMLVVWPQWHLVTLLLISPAIASVGAGSRLMLTATVFGVVLVLIALAGIRTLLDYWLCSRVSPAFVILGVLLHPLALSLTAVAMIAVPNSSHAEYVWHLLTRV